MYAKDFEYDGQALSDYNCVVCDFDGSSGAVFASAGSSITFNKVSRNFGRTNSLAGIQYGECITATFDICKDPDVSFDNDIYLSSDECRDLMRWLNRGNFYKFRVLYDDDDIDTFYYNASFNVEKIKVGERVCGLRLTMETDKPYAYGVEEKFTFTVTRTTTEKEYLVKDVSDDIGELYPMVSIVCAGSGDLKITNTTLGKTTLIQNCTRGEKITIDGNTLMVTTSSSDSVWDRFNYVFPQITNSLKSRVNTFKFSLPCTITISYSPIMKETF